MPPSRRWQRVELHHPAGTSTSSSATSADTTEAPQPDRPVGPESAAAVRAGSDDVVDAVVDASRALVAIATRSLGSASEDITLPQFRSLVVLASRGPQRLVDLALAFDVNASTVTRMCDRLAAKGLVRRDRLQQDRRTVQVSITDSGGRLVSQVMARRRAEVRAIVVQLPGAAQDGLVEALRAFAAAAGEVPEQEWWLGWHTADDNTSRLT